MNEISVIVATYKPDYKKTIATIDSILNQKNIDLEIIVCDDGSEENNFDKIKDYFLEKGFNNYTLIPDEENKGTVENITKGVRVAKGEYIKAISPGDTLNGENILHDWVEFIKKEKREWSFCDCIYYDINSNTTINGSIAKHPEFLKVYKNKKDLDCRIHYLVFCDNVNGAATICRKDVMLSFLEKIIGKVRLGEDNIYRLMMNENICPAFFEREGIVYEFGSGVSTSGSGGFKTVLDSDRKNTNKIIYNTKRNVLHNLLLKPAIWIIEETGMFGIVIRVLWFRLMRLLHR